MFLNADDQESVDPTNAEGPQSDNPQGRKYLPEGKNKNTVSDVFDVLTFVLFSEFIVTFRQIKCW